MLYYTEEYVAHYRETVDFHCFIVYLHAVESPMKFVPRVIRPPVNEVSRLVVSGTYTFNKYVQRKERCQ